MTESNSQINNWTYFAFISLYLVFLSVILAIYGYRDSFLLLNGADYNFLDWPMFVITHLGDALILTSLLTVVFIWKQPKAVMNLIIVVIISGLLGQLLKVSFFEGCDRPLRVFNESPIVHTLPNYRLFHNSFPSGHSITAMAAFTTLVWSIKPKYYLQIVVAILASLITYSRVYLGVHFPGDVLAGSLFGILMPLLLTPVINKLSRRISFSKPIKIVIALTAAFLFIFGIWFIRIYFPLI